MAMLKLLIDPKFIFKVCLDRLETSFLIKQDSQNQLRWVQVDFGKNLSTFSVPGEGAGGKGGCSKRKGNWIFSTKFEVPIEILLEKKLDAATFGRSIVDEVEVEETRKRMGGKCKIVREWSEMIIYYFYFYVAIVSFVTFGKLWISKVLLFNFRFHKKHIQVNQETILHPDNYARIIFFYSKEAFKELKWTS